MDVTVTVTPDGEVSVTVSDDTGYSPDLAEDLCRRARETAITAHTDLRSTRGA